MPIELIVMVGTVINAVGILVGGLAASNPRWQLSPARQLLVKTGLGVFTVYAGFKLVWDGLNGSFGQVVKQFVIVLLAMVVGKAIGKVARLQHFSNQVGEFARKRMAACKPGGPKSFQDGFVVCAGLFCVAPLAILGALQDGLQNNWHLLAIKGVMDGLAVMAFVPMFGRGVILAVVPVVAWQGLLTLGAKSLAVAAIVPVPSPLADSLSIACGLLAFSVSLIILDLKKIELAAYLPTLVLAPLLTKWLM